MFERFRQKLTRNLAIDLGTCKTMLSEPQSGLFLTEPTIVAVNKKTDQILAVGSAAKAMIGKNPSHIEIIKPLVDGVVSDFEVTEKLLKYFIDQTQESNSFLTPKPAVVIGIPLDITEVEKKAVEDAAKSAGARQVFLVEEPMLSAIGAGLPIMEATATMLVDIGGGTTEIAVLALGGCVAWKSLRLAGNAFNNEIIQHIREEFSLLIGEQLAEEIKIKIGSATPQPEELTMAIRGRDLINGLPKEIIINDEHVREAIARPISQIIDNIKATLEVTPPELVADIYERGIMLAGGSSLLAGFDQAIARATKIGVHIVDEPISSVVRGAAHLLTDTNLLDKVVAPSLTDL
ncbi:MAG TPA: rod shape-determining protein [bacterium]|jgi:rod shape-determining protein MreB|nr:rod shape-determining protein [bacterium]HNZ51118.1 rod shape-determining protein [bacterium]HPX64255.1 rod shape-determining protein [bacterium]HQA83913.1 rod shape-determining protein [bacterium]